MSVTQVVPAAAAGHELAVSGLSTSGSVNFASFAVIPAEPAVEGEPAAAPAALHLERASFAGSIIALCQVGTPQPTT